MQRRPSSLRSWLVALVWAFAAYYALIVYCELGRPLPLGATLAIEPDGVYVSSVLASSVAAAAGLQAGDIIRAADGRAVHNRLDVAAIPALIGPGHHTRLSLDRRGVAIEADANFTRDLSFWEGPDGAVLSIDRGVQLVTLVTALLLAWRAHDALSAVGALLLATIAVYNVGFPPRLATVWAALPVPVGAALVLPASLTGVIGGWLMAFFALLARVPWTLRRWILVCASLVPLWIWRVLTLSVLVYDPSRLSEVSGIIPVVVVVNLAYVAAGVAVLFRGYGRLTEPVDRRRLRWVVAGSIVGCSAAAPAIVDVWLTSSDAAAMYTPPMFVQLGYTTFIAMPISVWWATARHRLFDIGFVVRRGLQYALARRALLVSGPVAIVLLLIESTRHADLSAAALLAMHGRLYVAVMAGLVALHVARGRLLDALDRHLFRARYEACRLLQTAVHQVEAMSDVHAASTLAISHIERALHPEWAALYRAGVTETSFVRQAGGGVAPDRLLDRDGHLLKIARTLRRAISVDLGPDSWLVHELPLEEAADARRWGLALIVPVCLDDHLDAVVACGAKQSGEPYSREDKVLLEALAHSLSGRIRGSAERDRQALALADAVARGEAIDWRTLAPPDAPAARGFEPFRVLEGIRASQGAHWGVFQLKECLGEGSVGRVYRAWDPGLQRDVALKVLHNSHLDRLTLLDEARRLARVKHANVVHVYGAHTLEGAAAFSMELVEGQTLLDVHREHGVFSVADLAAAGRVMALALAAIHDEGLVHQDVKAHNVMRDTHGRLVLMDLGAGGRPNAPVRFGTPAYMAPELFVGAPASVRSDVYSLGALLFFLATGALPVEGESREHVAVMHAAGQQRSIGDARVDLPAPLVGAIDRALSRVPDDRFASARDFASALHL